MTGIEFTKATSSTAPAPEGNPESPAPRTVIANSGTSYEIPAGKTTIILTLTGNCSITFPPAIAGETFRLILKQDVNGSRIVYWPGLYWPSGTAPTLTSEAHGIDDFSFVSDGTSWFQDRLVQKLQLPSFASYVEAQSGLVGFWLHTEPSGTTMTDSSGSANNGEYKGAPVLGKEGGIASAGLSDAKDTAVSFTGSSSQYGTVPKAASLRVGDAFTYFTRVKVQAAGLGKKRGLIALGTGALYIRINEENVVQLLQQNEHVIAYCGTIPNDGKYHTLVIGKNGATITAEIDGVNTLAENTNFTLKTPENPVLVGTGEATGEYGYQEQFADTLFNRLLSEAERVKLHHLAAGPAVLEVIKQGFEEGNLNGWNLAGVGTVNPTVQKATVHSGTYAAAFKLVESQQRSELIFGGNGSTNFEPVRFAEGSSFTYRFYYYIKQFAYGRPGSSGIFCQLKAAGEGSPEFALELWNYVGDHEEWKEHPKGLFIAGYNKALGRYANIWVANVSENAWHQFEVDVVVSGLKAGSWIVKLDGVKVAEETEVNTMIPGRPYTYLKNGIYRGAVGYPGTSETFLDDAELIL